MTTRTSRPTARRQCLGAVSGRSTPGLVTSSTYGPGMASSGVSGVQDLADDPARLRDRVEVHAAVPVDDHPQQAARARPQDRDLLKVEAGAGHRRLEDFDKPGSGGGTSHRTSSPRDPGAR